MSHRGCCDESELLRYCACELAPQAAEDIEAHLEDCGTCRRLLFEVLESGERPLWLQEWKTRQSHQQPNDDAAKRGFGFEAARLRYNRASLTQVGDYSPFRPTTPTVALLGDQTVVGRLESHSPRPAPLDRPDGGQGVQEAEHLVVEELVADQKAAAQADRIEIDTALTDSHHSESTRKASSAEPTEPVEAAEPGKVGGVSDSELGSVLPQRMGQFVVVRRIAAGGMGVIYEGRDTLTQRRVALKRMLIKEQLPSLQRVINEAQALARLSHPSIVTVYEIVTYHDSPVLVLEFVEGCTLNAWQNHRLLEARSAASLVRDLALAVDHAHARGVIHRDLKPSNVMLVGHPRFPTTGDTGGNAALPQKLEPKITDFGIARLADQGTMTKTGELLGTPGYMAPELTTGATEAVGPAVDIYGLGAILYELLTGRPPFTSVDPLVTLGMVRDCEPVDPRVLRPDLPLDLTTICLKCLEKKPEQRLSSARFLAEELTAFLEDRPIVTRRIGPVLRFRRWCGRNRRVAAAGGFALLCLMLVVGSSLVFARYQRQLRTEADRQTVRAQTAEVQAAHQAELAKQTAQRVRRNHEQALEKLEGLLYFLRGKTVSEEELRETTRGIVSDMYIGYLSELGDPETWTLQHARAVMNYVWLNKNWAQAKSAADWLDKARTVLARLTREQGDDPELLNLTCALYELQAHVAELSGNLPQAAEYHIQTAKLLETIVQREHHESRAVNNCEAMYANAARSFILIGNFEQALENAQRSLAWQQTVVDAAPSDASARLLLVERMGGVAWLQLKLGRSADAEQSLATAQNLLAGVDLVTLDSEQAHAIRKRVEQLANEIQNPASGETS